MARSAIAAAALASTSCAADLTPGEWGDLRFMARVRGAPPLAVVAPVSDRGGNVYTLYGAIGLPEAAAYVSRATGGSSEPCTLTRGDVFGAHGWVGFADDRAWYWSGDLLVQVAAYEACEAILREDPKTNVELRFTGVFPYVRVTPSRSSLVALIRSASDPVPFAATVDLTRKVTTNVTPLPIDGEVKVLGVGADRDSASGFALVAVEKDGETTMRSVFVDEVGNVTAVAVVRGLPPPEYGVLGWLEQGPTGTILGLTNVRSLVAFDRTGGVTVALEDDGFEPAGLHRFAGDLWLVGTSAGRTVIRTVDERGRVGPIQTWAASDRAAAALRGPQTVRDDRQLPVRTATWPEVVSAIGAQPFLGPHSPWAHAEGTTLWAVAGPRTEVDGARVITSLAVAPVGISYP